MTLTGSGFNAPRINLFTIAGAPGPLVPLPGGSSGAVRIVVPTGVATGPGALQIVNAPYAGNVMSNAVAIPIGAAIGITRVSQAGAVVTVDGTGFCPSTVLNLFNRKGMGTLNLGGITAAGAPRIALTSVSAMRLTFAVPPGAASGPAYLQGINPPFIADSSTGGDPDGAFALIAGG